MKTCLVYLSIVFFLMSAVNSEIIGNCVSYAASPTNKTYEVCEMC